jgi:hypothetical protein
VSTELIQRNLGVGWALRIFFSRGKLNLNKMSNASDTFTSGSWGFGAPSLPEKVVFEYVTDASGDATIQIEITEALGAAAVTQYQFAIGNFTERGDSGGWLDFPASTSAGCIRFRQA